MNCQAFKRGTRFIAICNFDLCTRAIGNAQRQIGGDFWTVERFFYGQATASGCLRAFQTIFADFWRDVDVGFFWQKSLVPNGLYLLCALATVIGNAALFVGNDNFDAVF